ncbi:MAG TPA: LysR family transcriptional regulator [Xanthobacteraceae bacterium]|jgi:DNA-binding transcriptional LysR family regulator|nr:LysR family transcriptional regulator [Xanthobacteraceae bacterium]
MYNMHIMHIDDLELGEIRLVAALAELNKLSAAAARVGLSQSAASHALARLRARTGDPLFVRGTSGFYPTPYGERLSTAARRALDILLDGIAANPPFDPTSTTRKFNVYLSDVGQMVFLPKLLALIVDEAPRAALRVCPIPLEQPGAPLASGEVDLAVGFFRNLTAGFRQSMLFRERYVCVVRADHPNFRSGMSADAFACSQRAIADASGMGHAVVEEELVRQGFAAVPSLTVPQFMVLPLVIASSDLLVIMPSRLAKAFAQLVSIKILKPPVTLPPYDIKIYWHERFDRDPAGRWFRKAFVQLFRE